MTAMPLTDLAEKMRDIDFTMLSTRTDDGALAARPMSNNGDVDYDGDSFFFAYGSTRTISDIERDPSVGLAFQGRKGLLGKPPLFVTVEGRADVVRDKQAFKAHWTSDLDHWFKDGIYTPDLVMIHVHATRIHYWDGSDEGEIRI